MKSIRYQRYGDPQDVLEVSIADAPPAPIDDQVLIRVLLSPMHPGDLLGVQGRYRGANSRSGDVPGGVATPGFEGMGVVEAVGSRNSGFTVGQRVMFFPTPASWSEYVMARAPYVTAVPDGMPNEVAAQIHVTTLTALMLLRAAAEAGQRQAEGQVMLVSAAGSAVSRLTIMIAQRAGYEVIGLVRSQSGAETLRTRLPGVSVIATDSEDWQDQVRSAIGGRAVRVAMDSVGGALAARLIELLDNGGTLFSYGDLSGEPMVVPALAFSTRGIVIRGVSVGSWSALSHEQRRTDMGDAIDLALNRPEHYRVHSILPLADVKAAVREAAAVGRTGTVLLSPI